MLGHLLLDRLWYLVCHMRNSVAYPIWRRMLGYIKYQLCHYYHLMTLGVQVRFLIS